MLWPANRLTPHTSRTIADSRAKVQVRLLSTCPASDSGHPLSLPEVTLFQPWIPGFLSQL